MIKDNIAFNIASDQIDDLEKKLSAATARIAELERDREAYFAWAESLQRQLDYEKAKHAASYEALKAIEAAFTPDVETGREPLPPNDAIAAATAHIMELTERAERADRRVASLEATLREIIDYAPLNIQSLLITGIRDIAQAALTPAAIPVNRIVHRGVVFNLDTDKYSNGFEHWNGDLPNEAFGVFWGDNGTGFSWCWSSAMQLASGRCRTREEAMDAVLAVVKPTATPGDDTKNGGG